MNSKEYVLLLAGGNSLRLCEAVGGPPKQFISYRTMPLYMHSVDIFRKISYIDGVVIALPEIYIEKERESIERYAHHYGFPCYIVAGGNTRMQSMQHAYSVLPSTCQYVYIHDAARPFVSPHLIHSLYTYLHSHNDVDGVIPAIAVKDTIKVIDGVTIQHTPPRDNLVQAQTPQYFCYTALGEAIERYAEQEHAITDDASLLEHCGYTVHTIRGEESNIKITTPHDLHYLQEQCSPSVKVTMGYDVHAYDSNGRPYIIGGIAIDTQERIQAHSDGDVVLHALIDALLACTDKGDIGTCFPDADASYDGISSALLLHSVLESIHESNITIHHVDVTIVAQVPKLQNYMDKIKTNIAYLLGIDKHCVSIKATTEEYLGFTGRKEGVKAYALVTTTQHHK